jgi:adenosylcobinamide-phosphate synthase
MKRFRTLQKRRFLETGTVVVMAIGIDIVAGEPPVAIHPVVWMGRLINLERKALPAEGRIVQLLSGGALVAANLYIACVAGAYMQRGMDRLPLVARLGAQAVALNALMSLRMLGHEARRVAQFVNDDDTPGARRALRSLVSRDTADLDSPLILAAAIQSVAENASDSVIAPLLSYALFGLPGAAVYRMANTMDSMIGYHGSYEHLGKAAARLDDLLNLVPARDGRSTGAC